MADRRVQPERRRLLPRSTTGRRLEDAGIPSDTKAALERIAASARAQGKLMLEAVMVAAIARLEELEAAVALGGLARAQSLTPERRKAIAQAAARARWDAGGSV